MPKRRALNWTNPMRGLKTEAIWAFDIPAEMDPYSTHDYARSLLTKAGFEYWKCDLEECIQGTRGGEPHFITFRANYC